MSVSIRVVFDFGCPYCYLAWKYTKKLKQTIPLNDEWMTWRIHPEAGPEGMDITEVNPAVDLAQRAEKLNSLGAAIGVAPGDITFVPDTRLALEAVEFAAAHGKALEWCDAVFTAHFEQGKNIGNKAVLLAIAHNIGLDETALDKALVNGLYSAILADHDNECARKQVEWVPTVFANDKKILEGVITYEEMEQAISSLCK